MKPNLVKFFIMIGMITLTASSCLIGRGYKYAHLPPLINDDFRLDLQDYSKIFDLKFKYYDWYALSITNGDIGFPEKYSFSGKLKLQFFYKDKLVRETEIEKQEAAGGDYCQRGYNREIILYLFKIPIDNKYKNNLSLKVTVIKPDTNISWFSKELKIVIDLSPYE